MDGSSSGGGSLRYFLGGSAGLSDDGTGNAVENSLLALVRDLLIVRRCDCRCDC